MRRALFAFLALAACTHREQPAPPAPAPRVPAELLAQVRASAPAFARFGRAPLSGLATLPGRSDGVARLALDPTRALAVRALDVASVPEARVEHASLFASVAPSTDLLLAAEGDRFEELRVMHDERAPATMRWVVTPSEGIASLRVEQGAIEALDRAGRVAIRSGRVFAVDAKGVQRAPTLSLVQDGASWLLEATLDRAGLAYPIVVDPVWLPGPAMSFPRTRSAAIRAADGKVYVACGGTVEFEVFDPATASFKSLTALSESLSDCAMFLTSDGKLRVVGSSATVHTYTIATDTWTVGTSGAASEAGPAPGGKPVWLANGRLLVIGGEGSPASKVVSEWAPISDTWTAKGPLLAGRQDHSAVLLSSGKVMVAGGVNINVFQSSSEIYDPATDTWTSGPSMPTTGAYMGSLVLPDGRALFAAGLSAAGVYSKNTAVYDPTAGTMTAGPSLAVARDYPSLTRLADGRVLAVGGGFFGEGSTNVVDALSATLATASAELKLLQPRAYAPAVELADGRLLVIGGISTLSFGTASTELLSSIANGKACSWAGECASGFCVSGVCCEKACGGECERCAVPGKEGFCLPAAAGTECGAAASCTGSKLAGRGRCTGTDTSCNAGVTTDCAGGLICADATSCLAKCTKDADCTTNRCETTSGLCLPPVTDAGVVEDAPAPVAPVPEGSPKVLGSAQRCTNASECATGFCVDGVCCDSACKDRCHSCALPSSPGRCAEEPIGVDLRAECGAALSCSGTCGKGGVCTTSVAGSQCRPSTCTGPSSGKGAAVCVAKGGPCGVEAAVAFECGAYACDPAFGACRTSCTSSDACAPGFTCNTDKKNCERLADTEDSSCAMSARTQGGTAAGLVLLAMALRASRGSRRRGR